MFSKTKREILDLSVSDQSFDTNLGGALSYLDFLSLRMVATTHMNAGMD